MGDAQRFERVAGDAVERAPVDEHTGATRISATDHDVLGDRQGRNDAQL